MTLPCNQSAECATDAASVEQALADVQTAIEAVEQRGQRFRIKDREVWRADLAVLDKRADKLARAADRAKRGGVRVQRIVPL